MEELILDSLFDSFKIFAFAFLFYFLFSFLEGKVASLLGHEGKKGPAVGAILGLVPQCGIPVVSADLYKKRHITAGTLLAVFLVSSDESLPVLFSSPEKIGPAFAMLGIKFVGALAFGYLLDCLYRGGKKETEEHHHHCEGEDESHLKGCCGHHVEGEESAVHAHLIHPIVHSLRIFAISFVTIFLFGLLMEFYGGAISSFLSDSLYYSPLVAALVGLIPNCASSVLISNLYVEGALPFGALLAGLSVNTGLGLFALVGKGQAKRAMIVVTALVVISLALGYAFIWLGL